MLNEMLVLLLFCWAPLIVLGQTNSTKDQCLRNNDNTTKLSSNVYIYDFRLFENFYIKNFSHQRSALFKDSAYGANDTHGDLTNDYCKHSLDAIFIEDIRNGIIKNKTNPNSETIFVIPFMLGKNEFYRWYKKKLLSPDDKLEAKIISVLKLFPYFDKNKVNHFIMGDSWVVSKGFKGMIQGRFEGRHKEQSVSVGYSTAKTLAMRFGIDFCGYSGAQTLLEERPFKFSYVGAMPHSTDKGESTSLSTAFGHRTYFLHSYETYGNTIWVGIPHFVRAVRKGWAGTEHRLGKDKVYDYMRNSLFTMNFYGDSPTTDRIFNAIDTATIVMALDCDKAGLMRTLPFPEAIDWDSFFLWVNSTKFSIWPQKTVVRAINDTSVEEIRRRQRLIIEIQEKLSLWKNPVAVYENLWVSVRNAMDKFNCQKTLPGRNSTASKRSAKETTPTIEIVKSGKHLWQLATPKGAVPKEEKNKK